IGIFKLNWSESPSKSKGVEDNAWLVQSTNATIITLIIKLLCENIEIILEVIHI
ncbi:MAG: hypothetical protein RLY46_1354, partial [Bacteroidota bacterium]